MESKREEVQVVVKEPTHPLLDGDGGCLVFYLRNDNTDLLNLELLNLKPVDVFDSIQKARVETFNSLLVHTMTIMGGDSYCDFSDEDSDAEYHTGKASPCPVSDAAPDDDDHEGCVGVDVHDILYDESVKKKLQVLAAMVGIVHSASPGVVLAEVVRVLKDLERKSADGNGIAHNKILYL